MGYPVIYIIGIGIKNSVLNRYMNENVSYLCKVFMKSKQVFIGYTRSFLILTLHKL